MKKRIRISIDIARVPRKRRARFDILFRMITSLSILYNIEPFEAIKIVAALPLDSK